MMTTPPTQRNPAPQPAHLGQPVDVRFNVGQAFQTDAALAARTAHLMAMLETMIADRIRFGGSDPLDAEGTVRLAIADCQEARKAVRAATYPRFVDDRLRDEDLSDGDHFAYPVSA